MPLTFVKSRKGKDKLVHDGYMFRLARKNEILGTASWRCSDKTCKTMAHMKNDVVTVTKEHMHAPEMAKIEVAHVVSNISVRARTTHETPRQMITEATSNISEEVAAHLPKYNSMQRTNQRKRKREQMPYATPTSLADINIPAELRITKHNENFLFFDSGPTDLERILIFTTDTNIQHLKNCQVVRYQVTVDARYKNARYKVWLVDGTFKVSPELFYQLWSIHGLMQNVVLPLVSVLMPGKGEALYTKVLDALCKNNDFQPDVIISNFEKAQINSLKGHFPGSTLHGCFFHLGQNVWRKVQDLGFRNRYTTDDEFRAGVKQLIALAFIKTDDVVETFEELREIAEADPDILSIFDYFENTYIGQLRRHNRIIPPFPIADWNCHDATADEHPRTNNNVEGWHRALQSTLGLQHPQVYKLVAALINEQSLMELRKARLVAGEVVSLYSKSKYRELNRRLQNLVADYNNRDRMEYLRGCAYCFNL